MKMEWLWTSKCCKPITFIYLSLHGIKQHCKQLLFTNNIVNVHANFVLGKHLTKYMTVIITAEHN